MVKDSKFIGAISRTKQILIFFLSFVVLKFYLQLRQSLVLGEHGNFDAFFNPKDDNEDNGYNSGDAEPGTPDLDMPESTYMNEDVGFPPKMVRQSNINSV